MNIRNDLIYERVEIDKIIKQNETISSAGRDSQLMVEQYYYNYIVFFLVALLLVLLLVKFGIGGGELGGAVQNGGCWLKKLRGQI
jgi:hypothetical protein